MSKVPNFEGCSRYNDELSEEARAVNIKMVPAMNRLISRFPEEQRDLAMLFLRWNAKEFEEQHERECQAAYIERTAQQVADLLNYGSSWEADLIIKRARAIRSQRPNVTPPDDK